MSLMNRVGQQGKAKEEIKVDLQIPLYIPDTARVQSESDGNGIPWSKGDREQESHLHQIK